MGITSRPGPGRRAVALVAIILFVITFAYRFSTLGGALGGFDDDHFMQLAYAAQVQAGERPVRDFIGVSLQGVWPPLGFEASALARELMGNNLRSEAVLTSSVMAAGAVVTFVAATFYAPILWGLATTLLTVLLAPKLYAFPKIAVLSAAVLLLTLYARRPTKAAAAALAVLAAAAFLFRHDYAVYVGVGVVTVFVATWVLGPPKGGPHVLSHAILFGALTLLLLTPSLVFVERNLGLVKYFDSARENAARESGRTALALPAISLGGDTEENSAAILYWVFMLLPAVAVVRAIRSGRQDEAWRQAGTIAIAATAVVASYFMLRANLGARLGDVGPTLAVLGAIACAPALRPFASRATTIVRLVALTIVLAVVTKAIWTVGSVGHEVATLGWPNWPVAIVKRAARVSGEIAGLPAAAWSDVHATGSMLTAQYLNQCSEPNDRIFMLSYAPELIPFSGRLFAGGVASLVITANTPDGDAFVLGRLQSESVPFVLAEAEQLKPLSSDYGPRYFPRVHAYLNAGYQHVGAIGTGSDEIHVLVQRSRVPKSTYRDTGLPCFR